MNGALLGPALIALASAALYALGLVLTQFALKHRSPVGIAAVSLPTTAVALGLLAPLFLDTAGIEWRAVAIFIGVGLAFPVGVTLLTFEANRRMGPNFAGALGNITPLFALAFAFVLLSESLTIVRAAGAFVVICGVVLLSWRGSAGARRWPLWALLIPLAAAAIRGGAQSLIKLGLVSWNEPYAATLLNYMASAAVILSIVAVQSLAGAAPRAASPRVGRERGMFMLIALANGSSILLLSVALSRGSVALVAPLNATYPLFTLVLSAVLLHGEPLTGRLIVGAVVTVIGVALVLAG